MSRKPLASRQRKPAPKQRTAAARTKEIATLTLERERLASVNAQIAETKLSKLRGELVEAAAVEAEWSRILRAVRNGMLAVPGRLAQSLPHFTANDVSEIDREIRATLTLIGNEQ